MGVAVSVIFDSGESGIKLIVLEGKKNTSTTLWGKSCKQDYFGELWVYSGLKGSNAQSQFWQ